MSQQHINNYTHNQLNIIISMLFNFSIKVIQVSFCNLRENSIEQVSLLISF